jgi:AraC-like DNA-binding protein
MTPLYQQGINVLLASINGQAYFQNYPLIWIWARIFFMSLSEPILHPVVISKVMINFAAQLGIDRETCLLGTDITQEQLSDGDALITRAQEMRLIENLILALPDEPALGFRFGLQYNVSTFGVWGFAIRTSRTLREAANLALRYLPLSTAYCNIDCLEEGGHLVFIFDPGNIPSPIRQFLLERDMATALNLLKELSLSGITFSKIEFQGDPPEYTVLLEQTFGIKPSFNCQRNATFVSIQEADQLLPTYDAKLVRLMQEQCSHQLAHRQQTGVTGQVRKQLLGDLGLVATLEETASVLAMSPRSLRRKLEQEGTSFKQLVDQERQQIALQLLQGSQMKLDEIAFHLGYTDTASFSRAFRRWKGCSPGSYR